MEETLKLSDVICIYSDRDTALCTMNPVLDAGGMPTIGPGRPLSRVAISKLVQKLSGAKQIRTVIPERVVFVDSVRMAWWSPYQVRPIYFKTRCKTLNRVLGGALVLHPALLFVADPGRLSVFALAKNERPNAAAKLFRAPYYNVYDGGNMCAGNIQLPLTTSVDDINVWEDGFFNTEFTHTNIGRSGLTNHPRSHAGFWCRMARLAKLDLAYLGCFSHAASKYLVPLRLTLLEAINR
jgi:PRTRC genetic system protein B